MCKVIFYNGGFMKTISTPCSLSIGSLILFFCINAHAVVTPLPAITVIPVGAYKFTATTGKSYLISYKISNNRSSKASPMTLQSIQGITQASSPGCPNDFSLNPWQSCTLKLSVIAVALNNGGVSAGPTLCVTDNLSQCYSPATGKQLTISKVYSKYTIRPSSDLTGTISPSTNQLITYGDGLSFSATPGADVAIKQWLLDGKPVQNGGSSYNLSNIVANHTLKVTYTKSLTPSTTSVVSSVACSSDNPSCAVVSSNLTGKARLVTIQNRRANSATNVSVSGVDLPLGTTISGNTCTGTINGNSACSFSITPGPVSSKEKSSKKVCTLGTSPTPSVITVKATGLPDVKINVLILGYGCIYQGGYVFAIDDTTAADKNISGKVAATVDQAAPGTMVWSPAGRENISLWGISELSTVSTPAPNDVDSVERATLYAGQRNCKGATDGACNTNNIFVYYNTFAGYKPTLQDYAIGLCKKTIPIKNGYSDWYLPAICEMGTGRAGCGSVDSPAMQNMQSNLAGNSFAGLSGAYWSSTEGSGATTNTAWNQAFSNSNPNGGYQDDYNKNANYLGVRCIRAFAP